MFGQQLLEFRRGLGAAFLVGGSSQASHSASFPPAFPFPFSLVLLDDPSAGTGGPRVIIHLVRIWVRERRRRILSLRLVHFPLGCASAWPSSLPCLVVCGFYYNGKVVELRLASEGRHAYRSKECAKVRRGCD